MIVLLSIRVILSLLVKVLNRGLHASDNSDVLKKSAVRISTLLIIAS